MGSIYMNTGSRPFERNIQIYNNYVRGYHFDAPSGLRVVSYGIYVDNGSQGYYIKRNLLDSIEESAVFIHGGGFNVVRNNIFRNSHSPYFSQNLYQMNWAHGLTKSALRNWFSQRETFGREDSPHSGYPGLLSFYKAITPEIYDLVINATSTSEYMMLGKYQSNEAFVQRGNVFSDNLLFNSPEDPINKNNYWSGQHIKILPEKGVFISSYFGDWSPYIEINNIVATSTDPFSVSISGPHVWINLNEDALFPSGISTLGKISEKEGVRWSTPSLH